MLQLRKVTTRDRRDLVGCPLYHNPQSTLALRDLESYFCQLHNNSPAKLICVSQAWRDVANATPQLWTDVHIRHPHQFADPAALSPRL
ncbi:hypothetical protein JB92DRAFT_3070541, partial [Gautieria morchelliformis]